MTKESAGSIIINRLRAGEKIEGLDTPSNRIKFIGEFDDAYSKRMSVLWAELWTSEEKEEFKGLSKDLLEGLGSALKTVKEIQRLWPENSNPE